MIHLHSMFSSETNTPASGTSSSATLSKASLDSFHGALSDAVSSTLEKFGIHPNDVKISITRASEASASSESAESERPTVIRSLPGTNAGTPSNAGTSTTGTSTTGTSTTGTSTTGTSASGSTTSGDDYDPFLQAAISNPYGSASTTSASPTATQSSAATESNDAEPLSSMQASLTPGAEQQAYDQAYWASQPAAVQALRNIQNPEQRATLATQLANEGYSIDVPIMVWGWDPSITTAMRQADGYTWVPSALQNPVEDAPGLPAVGSIAAYNPNNPPAGSIMV